MGVLYQYQVNFENFFWAQEVIVILLLKEWKVIVKGDLQQADVIWHSDWNDCNFSSQVAWKNVFNFSSEMTSQVYSSISKNKPPPILDVILREKMKLFFSEPGGVKGLKLQQFESKAKTVWNCCNLFISKNNFVKYSDKLLNNGELKITLPAPAKNPSKWGFKIYCDFSTSEIISFLLR